MSDPLLLEVDGLRTHLATPSGTLHAVDGVSLRLRAGETLGIVGESGSGKSMLARTVMRLTPVTSTTTGSVRYGGRDLLGMAPNEARKLWGPELAMVFQNPMTALNPVVRVERQITESLRLHLGMGRAEARARAVELLDGVRIPDAERRLRTYPHELSGGMRQRVSIAIAIACNPKLLIADEPTTALDVTIQRQILDLIGRLRDERNMAMILISHDLGVVANRTDRVAVMYGGQIVETGPTRAIFRSPRHPYTAALLKAIPRLADQPHEPLATIPGWPADVVDPTAACRFVGRCPHAGPECASTDPPLVVTDESAEHLHACFHPLEPRRAAAPALSLNGSRHDD